MTRRLHNRLAAWDESGPAADYNAAKPSAYRRRRTGIVPTGSGADYHYARGNAYWEMMELFRDFERNDAIVGQGISRLVDNAIQHGFTLDPKTGNLDLDALLLARWRKFAGSPDECDIAQQLTFHQMERSVLRRVAVDGDILVAGTDQGALQLFEGHRLRTPSSQRKTTQGVVHGVRMDRLRRHVEYWVTKDELHAATTNVANLRDYIVVPARQGDERVAWLISSPGRLAQTRGVSLLAAIVDICGMHDDIQFATLIKQQAASAFGVAKIRAEGSTFSASPQMGERETETLDDGVVKTLEGVGPGMFFDLNAGEDIKFFAPNVPANEFFSHTKLLLTFIAINLGLPPHVLLLDPSQTNYSGWRGAIDQARLGFREIQSWMIARFHSPVYRWKVGQWLAEDPELARLAQAVDPYAHSWSAASWQYIDPLKDTQADLIQWANPLSSPRRIASRMGNNWDEIRDEIIEDRAAAIEKALARANGLNDSFKLQGSERILWRDLMPFPTAEGVSASTQQQHQDPDAETQPSDPPTNGSQNGHSQRFHFA